MKRWMLLLICAALALCMTACSDPSDGNNQSTSSTTSPEEVNTSQYPKPDSVGLEYEVNEDGVTCIITGIGSCDDTALSIGGEIDGYQVVGIADYAFFQNQVLTGISIHNSITQIGSYAFYGCSNVRELLLGEGIVSIGEYAFSNCISIPSVTIPNSLEHVGQWAFYYCPALEGVYISDLSSWLRIQFDSVYSNPLRYGGKLYLNEELVRSITLPEDVDTIGDWVLEGCISIEEVVLHENLVEIGERAFRACTNLKRITYNGTKEQWQNLMKDSNWNASMDDYVIVCTDGQIKG